MIKRSLSLFLVMSCLGILTLQLSGCGKKASPRPVGPPEKVTYPRGYPPAD